ncbi:MAG TPA: ADP-ribosylglycohydrolase family protein [Planctomycetota bacterium]|nr:ADP-ribosylglycohydrolase family protein [Planctomycetota bacterium]
MRLDYSEYYDKVLGGWIGKSMGGAIGARFEGNKTWIEISPKEMFPEKMPPNDDLDLQVLWLKVLEEKGAALSSADLAKAWLEGCWYPFNEYGIFRRNWKLGIHPPYSGSFTNQFWETGMGCPIRAEIWGYVFPGAPELAAAYAEKDGVLDHTAQSVGAEKMFAAMASMAFFISDVRRLSEMFIHYLPAGSPIDRLSRLAFDCFDKGMSLKDAHQRLLWTAGNSEACDAQINVPFTFLGLLYGKDDLQETMLSALKCGYDTDCTLATSAALIGQILGASKIPESLKKPVGDELVMGIEYKRPEMLLSSLARDTARVGVLLSKECNGIEISNAPALKPFPSTAKLEATRVEVEYDGLPSAAPGDVVTVTVRVDGELPEGAALSVAAPSPGWRVAPESQALTALQRSVKFTLSAPSADGPHAHPWPQKQLFTAKLASSGKTHATREFGLAGAALYQFLGVYFDPAAPKDCKLKAAFQQHYVALDRDYLPEPKVDTSALFSEVGRKIGTPPILVSREHDIAVEKLVGLSGALCAYLSRTVYSQDDREVFLVVGNTDSFRVYLNGERVAEENETMPWSPFNNSYKVKLKKGANQLLLKLLRRSDQMKFTLGFRSAESWMNSRDWCVDLADGVPGR